MGLKQGLLNGRMCNRRFSNKAQSNLKQEKYYYFTYMVDCTDIQTSRITWDGVKYGDNEKQNQRALHVEDAIDFDNGLVIIRNKI